MWKEVEELPGYEINEFGMVKNIDSGRIYKYHLSNNGYIVSEIQLYGNRKGIQQHQIVMRYHNNDYRLFQGMRYVIDHIDSIKTNNNIDNLRVVSQRENASKERTVKSGLPVGVHIIKNSKKNPYQAIIRLKNKRIYLGYYPTPELASSAYQEALKKHLSI